MTQPINDVSISSRRPSSASPWNALAAALLLLMLGTLGSVCHAQPGPGASESGMPAWSYADRWLQDVVRLEDEIAALAQSRDDKPQHVRAMVDLAIDLRVVRRWMAKQSGDQNMAGSVPSDLQADLIAVLELRRRELDQVIAMVDSAITDPATNASATTAAAVARLRAATFDLDGLTLTTLDQTLAVVGKESAAALGVTLPDPMPPMRPQPRADGNPSPAAPTSPAGLQSPAQIKAAVQQVTVSLPLRRQIAQLCDLVEQAKPDAKQALLQTLGSSFEIAQSLQRNTAVTPEVRLQIDQQLTAALALYNDPRTRDAGEARVARLVDYGAVSTRIEALPLSREARQQLMPVFSYVRDAGPSGIAVLEALERVLDAKLKLSQLPKANVPPQLRRALDDLRVRAVAQLDLTLEEIQAIGRRGAFSATPESVLQSVDRTLERLDVVLSLEQVDQTIATLNEFRPRAGPAAAPNSVERVLGIAVARLDDANRAVQGQRTIDDAGQLARSLRTLSAIDMSILATPVGRTYADVTLEEFGVAWRSSVNQALTQWIEKEAIEPDLLARLTGLAACVELLNQANEVETLLEQAALVTQWADWSVSRQSLGTARQPFAGALANAFGKLTRGEVADIDEVRKQREAIEPIVLTARRVVDHADQVRQFPGEPAILFLKLATPSNNAPFRELRQVSAAYDK